MRIWTVVAEAVSAAGLEPGVANSVRDAFFGRSVTPRYYRPLADVSVATATNDSLPPLPLASSAP
jgi:hypothetical protein